MAEQQPAEEEEKRAKAIFLDANIFIDAARRRKGWEGSSALLLGIKNEEGVRLQEAYISLLSCAIIYFTFLGKYSQKESISELKRAIKGCKIIDLNQRDFEEALEDDRLDDFEDRLQFYAARKVCKTIITRNVRHYKSILNEMKVLTPEEFLSSSK